MTDLKDLQAKAQKPEEPIVTVFVIVLAAIAGFCLPTAFAIWMGWISL